MDEQQPKKPFQFRLSTILLLMVIVGMGFGWWRTHGRLIQAQNENYRMQRDYRSALDVVFLQAHQKAWEKTCDEFVSLKDEIQRLRQQVGTEEPVEAPPVEPD